jgi:hypothetical protein
MLHSVSLEAFGSIFRAFHHGSLSWNVDDSAWISLTFACGSVITSSGNPCAISAVIPIDFYHVPPQSGIIRPLYAILGYPHFWTAPSVLDLVSARLRPGMQTPMMYAQCGCMAGYRWRCWSLWKGHGWRAAYTAHGFSHSFHDSGIRTLTSVPNKRKEWTCRTFKRSFGRDPKNGWLRKFSPKDLGFQCVVKRPSSIDALAARPPGRFCPETQAWRGVLWSILWLCHLEHAMNAVAWNWHSDWTMRVVGGLRHHPRQWSVGCCI